MPEGHTLTVVVLAYNSQNQIENCLKSLVGFADEVVVVDGFSTDATLEICRKYGVKVIQHKFEGDFGQERNIGIDNAQGEWILQLDTDEIVTEGFKKEVKRILAEDSEFVAYKFLRKNFFMNHFMRYGGWYHYSLHFFKKGFARYKGKVHHDLIVDGKVGIINGEIEHYPFQDFSQFIERQNRYTSLEAAEIAQLRPGISKKEVLYNIKLKPLKLFWKFYVKKKGFKEGMWGFIFAVLFAWVHFLKWSKVWAILKDANE